MLWMTLAMAAPSIDIDAMFSAPHTSVQTVLVEEGRSKLRGEVRRTTEVGKGPEGVRTVRWADESEMRIFDDRGVFLRQKTGWFTDRGELFLPPTVEMGQVVETAETVCTVGPSTIGPEAFRFGCGARNGPSQLTFIFHTTYGAIGWFKPNADQPGEYEWHTTRVSVDEGAFRAVWKKDGLVQVDAFPVDPGAATVLGGLQGSWSSSQASIVFHGDRFEWVAPHRHQILAVSGPVSVEDGLVVLRADESKRPAFQALPTSNAKPRHIRVQGTALDVSKEQLLSLQVTWEDGSELGIEPGPDGFEVPKKSTPVSKIMANLNFALPVELPLAAGDLERGVTYDLDLGAMMEAFRTIFRLRLDGDELTPSERWEPFTRSP